MKNLFNIMMIFMLGFVSQAQEKKDKNARIEIDVKGNCEMCKKRIEKAAYSIPGVKSAVWNSKLQKLNLILNEQKSSVNDIQKAVAKVGHDTKDVRATDASYKNLHECCAYQRD